MTERKWWNKNLKRTILKEKNSEKREKKQQKQANVRQQITECFSFITKTD